MGSIAGSDRTGERGEDAAAVMRAAPHTRGPVAAGAVLGTKRPSPEHRWQRPRAQVAAARHHRPSREQVPRWSSASQVAWRAWVWGGLSRTALCLFLRAASATLGDTGKALPLWTAAADALQQATGCEHSRCPSSRSLCGDRKNSLPPPSFPNFPKGLLVAQ